MNTNIYDILDQSFIVEGSVNSGLIVTWNGAHTLRLWQDRYFTDGKDGLFTEIDIRTLGTEPSDVFEAGRKAQQWLSDLFEEFNASNEEEALQDAREFGTAR